MFTGIIQHVGTIERKGERREGVEFAVVASNFARRLSPGDSVSINGVCQTVETVVADTFTFTAVGETLKRTTFDRVRSRSAVNLEAAATVETALGGHLVQGHVDGVGIVEAFEWVGKDRLLTIGLPESIFAYMVPKGSIAVDGVSLTIVEATVENRVTITIIPFTIEKTVFKHYRAGTRVNIEVDIVGKYVKEYLVKIIGDGSRREDELSRKSKEVT
ncbi:MAG: riboflavin synthase [Candidatus Krumholzibacteria bacterium]|nr:riboflavin synthase [Candidatus Krumholzibacteria bacterium]